MVEEIDDIDSAHTLALSNDFSFHAQNNSSLKNNKFVDDLGLDNNKIYRELFFICKNCNGPLIQHAFCRICKKTTFRICNSCNSIKQVGDHTQCFRIMLYDSMTSKQKLQTPNN